jgi:hypothetical protein
VPRFYPNVVTLSRADADVTEQRTTIELLRRSNLPGRWAVKDSFNVLDLARQGFDVLHEASWIRSVMPGEGPSTDIVWQRQARGSGSLPFDDTNFAMFVGRRGYAVVAGGMLYCAEGVVGLTNVVADAADAASVFRALILLSARTFPRLPVIGYEQGDELRAAVDAGFEIGDPLRVWIRARE